jgi:hypothetical protein
MAHSVSAIHPSENRYKDRNGRPLRRAGTGDIQSGLNTNVLSWREYELQIV